MRTYGKAADYIDRRFDLLVIQGAKPVGSVLLQQTIFSPDDGGEVCTGVQKVAQRWILKFLTPRGTMKFLPTEGNDFLRQVQRGEIRTESDAQAAFNIAAVEVRESMVAEETEDMNPEDRFDAAELLQLILQPDGISIKVRLTTLAGDSREPILPIPYLPIKTVI